MKKIILIIGIALFAISSYAQEDTTQTEVKSDYELRKKQREIQTIFGNNNRPLGVFIGTSFGYAPLGGNDAMVGGASCGLILGQHLGLGIIGKGFATDMNKNLPKDGKRYSYYSGGYGGLLVEPILFPKNPIHVTFPIVMGVGSVGYYWNEYDVSNEHWKDGYDYNLFFMVIEPGIEAEVNLTRYLRMSLGTSYRITSANNSANKDLDGLSIYMGLKLGVF